MLEEGARGPSRDSGPLMAGSDPSVSRWTRYGLDRLYVKAADGTQLGWLDLKTGRHCIDVPERVEEYRRALTEAGQGSFLPSAWMETEEPSAESPAWTDLAHNRPGQSAREQADQHLAVQRSRSRVMSALARAFDVKTDERAWRKGSEGEETVGKRLDRLTSHGWRVLHSVPVGDRGSDIDHVLVGPGGVFTVNTKNHPGKRIWVSPSQIRVDGQIQPYLRNSRFEADRSRQRLSAAVGWEVPTQAALVILTGSLIPNITIKSGGPTDVLVLDITDVPRSFTKLRVLLTVEQVEQVFEQARRSTLWV